MSQFLPFYLFSFLRVFEPITSFKTLYYMKGKKFQNNEIYNKILPTFFYAGLFFSIITPFFIKYLSSKLLMSGSSFSELVFILLITFMPERSKFIYLATILNNQSAFFNSLSSAFLSKLIANNVKSEKESYKIFGSCTMIKNIGSVISSVIGQEVFLKLKIFEPILFLSFMGLFSCFLLALSMDKISSKLQSFNLLLILKNGDYDQIKKCYNKHVLFHTGMYVISGVVYVAFTMFAGSIFLERKRGVSISRNFERFIWWFFSPIKILCFFYIKFYCFVFRYTIPVDGNSSNSSNSNTNNTNSNTNNSNSNTNNRRNIEENSIKDDVTNNENSNEIEDIKSVEKDEKKLAPPQLKKQEQDDNSSKIIFGYIDSLARVSATLISFLFSRIQLKTILSQKFFALFLVLILLSSMFLMGRTKTLRSAYIVYVIGLANAQTSMSLNKSAYYKHTSNKELIGAITILLENLVHITTSTLSRKFKLGINSKMLCYFGICIPFFILSLLTFE